MFTTITEVFGWNQMVSLSVNNITNHVVADFSFRVISYDIFLDKEKEGHEVTVPGRIDRTNVPYVPNGKYVRWEMVFPDLENEDCSESRKDFIEKISTYKDYYIRYDSKCESSLHPTVYEFNIHEIDVFKEDEYQDGPDIYRIKGKGIVVDEESEVLNYGK